MAVVYIPDNLLAKVLATGKEKQTFIKEAVEEKLKRSVERSKKFLKNENAVSPVVATLMLIMVAASGVVIASSLMRDIGGQTNDAVGKGSVVGMTAIDLKIYSTDNTTSLVNNLTAEYNKEQNGILVKSYTNQLNLTGIGVISSIKTKLVDVGIMDNISSSDLGSVTYYPIGTWAANTTINNIKPATDIPIYIISSYPASVVTKNFIDWVRSPVGQLIVNQSGYTSYMQRPNP